MKTRKLFGLWVIAALCAHTLVGWSADSAPNSQDVCVYVVKKGDTLSEILIRLGIQPQYGPAGTIADLASKNDVARNGDLIFPDVRIRVPREMVSRGEICLDGAQENNAARRVALYAQAEAQIHKSRYVALCKKIVEASSAETEPARKGRLLHFAAVCEYQEQNYELAYQHWQEVLQMEPDASLLYRANYNLALMDCQSADAARGYERLRQITPDLWQVQTEYDRRAFLDLAAFCSEKGSGIPAKLDILMGVLRDSQSEELRGYAAEKLQSEFSDSARCDHSKKVLEKIPEVERHRTQLQAVWNQACGGASVFDAHVQLAVGPTVIRYTTASAASQWVGFSGRLQFDFFLDSGWAFSTGIDSYLLSATRTGTALDVRTSAITLAAGRVFPLAPDLLLQTDLVLGQASLLTADRNVGYYDLLSYGARVHLRATQEEKDWLRASLGASLANSDTASLSSNAVITFGLDFFPVRFAPLFCGLEAGYSKLTWGGTNQSILRAGVHLGVAW